MVNSVSYIKHQLYFYLLSSLVVSKRFSSVVEVGWLVQFSRVEP